MINFNLRIGHNDPSLDLKKKKFPFSCTISNRISYWI